MQEELTFPVGGAADADEAEAAEVTASRPRRRLRQRWDALSFDTRSMIGAIVFVGVIAVVIVGAVGSALTISRHNTRVQAVQRAMKMDGDVFIIKTVGWNWFGDTRLYLQNARGEDAGWVMINSNNPLNPDVNPFFLAFSPKRYDPLPFPMRVRAHYRPDPWVFKSYNGNEKTYENFTGSFLEFERLDQEPGR